MEFAGINWRRVAIRSTYYLTTLGCLTLLGFALYQAHLYFDLSVVLWILLYAAIATWLVWAVSLTVRIRKGVHKVAFHCLSLQLIPILGAILIFNIIPDEEDYTPLTGKVNTYERHFNDLQSKQKAAAIKNGLDTFESRADIEEQYKRLRRQGKLVHIESCSDYIVRDLTASSPYVVPKVEELLKDIADRFQEKTQSKSRFVITSVLRTEEDVKKLRKSNINASKASCHCHATTIDISYVRFGEDKVRPRSTYDLRMALAQTLYELRKAGRCYVKIERKQYCYHITVR